MDRVEKALKIAQLEGWTNHTILDSTGTQIFHRYFFRGDETKPRFYFESFCGLIPIIERINKGDDYGFEINTFNQVIVFAPGKSIEFISSSILENLMDAIIYYYETREAKK